MVTWRIPDSISDTIDVPIVQACLPVANQPSYRASTFSIRERENQITKIAGMNRDSAVAEYEKAIQTAFREVSDSLRQ